MKFWRSVAGPSLPGVVSTFKKLSHRSHTSWSLDRTLTFDRSGEVTPPGDTSRDKSRHTCQDQQSTDYHCLCSVLRVLSDCNVKPLDGRLVGTFLELTGTIAATDLELWICQYLSSGDQYICINAGFGHR